MPSSISISLHWLASIVPRAQLRVAEHLVRARDKLTVAHRLIVLVVVSAVLRRVELLNALAKGLFDITSGRAFGHLQHRIKVTALPASALRWREGDTIARALLRPLRPLLPPISQSVPCVLIRLLRGGRRRGTDASRVCADDNILFPTLWRHYT